MTATALWKRYNAVRVSMWLFIVFHVWIFNSMGCFTFALVFADLDGESFPPKPRKAVQKKKQAHGPVPVKSYLDNTLSRERK